MKKVRYVSAAVLVSVALAGVALADPAASDQDNNPMLRYDQDGVPLSVMEKQPQKASPEEIAAYRKQQARAAADKDWLMRAYEKQLQSRDPNAATQLEKTDPYQQMSGNKDLAKMAGLPDFDDGSSDDSKPLPHTGETHSAAALHPGSAPITVKQQPLGSTFLRPMITPLSSPNSAGLNNFYSSLPVAGISPYYSGGQSQLTATLPKRVSVVPEEVDHDIDTPGMIAAEKNPLSDPNAADLTLDVLPGESLAHARAHQDDNSALPTMLDADQLHRAQAAELGPPVPKKSGLKQTAAVPPPAPPVEPYDAPVPASQLPVISAEHPAIASPYDILNR